MNGGTKPRRQDRFANGKEGQQPVVAGSHCFAHHAHRKAKVLHDRSNTHDAGVERFPQQHLQQWQNGHAHQHQRENQILRCVQPSPTGGSAVSGRVSEPELGTGGSGHLPLPGVRYFASKSWTRSNMSAGTILPRTLGYNFSAIARHSASSAGVATCTCMPRFCMAATACTLSLRLRVCIVLPVSSAAFRRVSRVAAGKCSHVVRFMTNAPTNGTQFTSSM